MTDKAPDSKNVGRPTKYSEELASEICYQLMIGKSLRRMCQDNEDLPVVGTIMRWLADDRGQFREQYAHAREIQAEYHLDEMIDIADDVADDFAITNGEERVNHEHINRAKLKIDTRKWKIEKQSPKRYGAKQQLEHTGGNGGPIETANLTPDQVIERMSEKRNDY